MTSPTIHITVSPKGQLYEARCGQGILITSRTPFLSAARILLQRGYPPDAILSMTHEGEEVVALRGRLGAAAKLTVVEDAIAGPRFGQYRAPAFGTAVPGQKNSRTGDR